MTSLLSGPFTSAVEKKVLASIRQGSGEVEACATEVEENLHWRAAALCYLAACAEEPQAASPWMRLAVFTDRGNTRDTALAEWRKLDSENGLPYYLCAADHAQRGSLAQALRFVEQGNRRGKYHKYKSPYPRRAQISYPDVEPFDEYSVVGMKVPDSVLLYAAHLQQMWFDIRMGLQLRELMRVLIQEADRLWENGDVAEAREYYYASLRMGLGLIRTRPCGLLDTFTGVANYGIAADALLARLKDERTLEERKALVQYGTHVDSLVDACRKLVEDEQALTEHRRVGMILRGKLLLAAERAALDKAIRDLPKVPESAVP